MSVYINGIEMPKSCADCPCASIFAGYKCMACGRQFDKYPLENRMDWCPIVEVPPHGRLIDADALMRSFHDEFDDEEVHDFECGAYWFHGSVINHVINSPTIIPAEEE